MRAKRKEQALSYLRSRKALEELLQKRMGALETLHGVLVKIEQAASDVEIMKAYEMSTSTLQTLLSERRLQPEHIDANMDKMQETLADAEEVQLAIQAGNEGAQHAAGVSDMDEQEMEAELAELQREVEKEKEQEARKGETVSQGQVEYASEASKAQDPVEAAPGPGKEQQHKAEAASGPGKEQQDKAEAASERTPSPQQKDVASLRSNEQQQSTQPQQHNPETHTQPMLAE